MLHAVLALSWLFMVWGICGGAICRIAVVRVARMEQTGLGSAIGFARRHAASLILAPFLPLAGLASCAAILAGFGLLYWVPAVGGVLGGLLFAIPLGVGLITTVLAAALAVSWPLLQAAVAAGAEDSLDALSRSFGYVNQRIGSLVALAGFAWVLGMIGIVLVNLLAAGVVRFTEWGLGLICAGGPGRDDLRQSRGGSPRDFDRRAFVLAGRGEPGGPRLGVQLFLYRRGARLSLAAT